MSHLYKSIEDALSKLQGAYAPHTLKSYYADARAFVDWCAERNVDPFPITSKTLCVYIEHLQQNAAYSSIRRRISSLRRLNKMLGSEDQTRTEEVYLAIRRLKRSKCLEHRQAVGINHDILVNMIDAQSDTLAGTRNRALLSLGYDFLARRSELVAIRSDDLEFTPDGALKGMIRKSKTDQYGKCEDRAICDRNVNDIIKRSVVKVKRCERPSDLEVSGHSLRVGAAQDLLIRGYDLAAIMRAGGWSDPSTVSRYLRFSQHNIWTKREPR